MFLHFRELDGKAEVFQKKYNYKKIRRVLIIDDLGELSTKVPANIQEHYETLSQSFKSHDIDMDKYFYLNMSMEDLTLKFGFLCIPYNYKELVAKEKNTDNYEVDINSQPKNSVSTMERQILYAYSRFPIILIENTLFVGNIFNANSSQQIKDMDIKSILNISYITDIDKKGEKINQE